MRFPLAIVVMIEHVTGLQTFNISDGSVININDFALTHFFIRFVKSFLVDQSVPIYFFIAGYVFFLNIHLSAKTYIRKLRNRFQSLFIPYILWNTLVIAIIILPHIPPFNKPWVVNPDFSVTSILQMFWDNSHGIIKYDSASNLFYPADAPLWFVRDLMIMALISPMLNWLFKHTNYLCVVISGVIWAIPATRYLGGIQMQEAFFFFSWGAWMSYRKRDKIVEFQKLFHYSLYLYPAMAIITFITANDYPNLAIWTKTAAIISGLFFAYNISFLLISKRLFRPNKRLTSAAFFVYSGHYIIIPYISRIVLKIIQPTNGAYGLLYYFIMIISITAILLFVFELLRKCAPYVLSPFNGGRI